MKERNKQIDILRFVGLTLIILAHVQAPYMLTQLRCFDVPLMVFVSGLTASGKPISSYWEYIVKRVKRLIIPVWLFLAVYLSSLYVVQFKVLPEQYLTWTMIWRSFLLLDESIGYVWIIRVFLLIMFVTPPLIKFNEKITTRTLFLFVILSLLIITQFLYYLTQYFKGNEVFAFIAETLLYTTAYSVPFFLGLRLRKNTESSTNRITLGITFLFGAMLGFYFLNNDFPIGLSSVYKVPPRSYYIVYGGMISCVLWCTKSRWAFLSKFKLGTWIGKNTIWIYLWHMPFALVLNSISIHWMLRYVAIYSISTFIFYLQYLLVKKNDNKFIKKYLLG